MRLTTKWAYLATVATVVAAMVSSPALAQDGISLNLRYDDPNSPAAGGTWQIVSQIDGLKPGDTDRDFDVDTADITTVISNFTGAGGTGKNWDLGDFDSDTDVDTADITAGIGNFTGAQAIHGNDGDHPDLVYNYNTGEVSIAANGQTILSFNLQSDNRFSGNADFSQLELDTFAVPGLSDNLPNAIGWVSAVATGGQGYHGTDRSRDNNPASLGIVFPTGLSYSDFQDMLTNNAWAGPGGTGGAFGVHNLPEPTSLLLASLCGLGLLTMRRRQAA